MKRIRIASPLRAQKNTAVRWADGGVLEIGIVFLLDLVLDIFGDILHGIAGFEDGFVGFAHGGFNSTACGFGGVHHACICFFGDGFHGFGGGNGGLVGFRGDGFKGFSGRFGCICRSGVGLLGDSLSALGGGFHGMTSFFYSGLGILGGLVASGEGERGCGNEGKRECGFHIELKLDFSRLRGNPFSWAEKRLPAICSGPMRLRNTN
jgi:hypothetical protein